MKTWVMAFLVIIFNEISASHSVNSDVKGWVLFPSPTRNKVTHIIAFDNGKAIAAANKLYIFNSDKWENFPVQPPVTDISLLQALNENHIWVTFSQLNNESDFYLFKNGLWNKLTYPLANFIQGINLNEKNEGWYCGDREITYYEKGISYLIPYPHTSYSVKQCFGFGKNNLWVSTFSDGLFHYDGKNWEKIFNSNPVEYFCFKNKDQGYALVGNTIFEYNAGKWKLHSTNTLLENVKKLYQYKNEFWGIGKEGLLVHYDTVWQVVDLPVKADLNDIAFSKDGTGWIAGAKGVIYKYTKKINQKGKLQPGFDRHRVFNAADVNNDEYGVVIEDFNGDGLKDIYATCIYQSNRLYINTSTGNQTIFSEESINRNVTGRRKEPIPFTEFYLGAGSADIDNDNDQDLYLCNLLNNNELLLNDGSGVFRIVSDQKDRATENKDRTNCALFSDVDLDGDLDLFILNEYSTNRLYLNNGYGYFTEVTISAGLETDYGGMGGVFCDFDNDNLPDLYIVNWSRPNIMYKNVSTRNNVKFERVEFSSVIEGGEIKKSNAVAAGDFDNDGDMDLFVTNRKLSNRLYRNEGNFIFTDITDEVIGSDSMMSYGANFADFDNDGFLDLFVANVGENILYKNIDGKFFTDVTESYGIELGGYSTGSATADIDNDGDIDLYVSNFLYESSMLFLNNINNDKFIKIIIQGVKSNRDAVGTKVWLYTEGKADNKEFLLGYREISGGTGYSSKDSREVHFGVDKGAYDIVIYFPSSGIKKSLNNISNGTILNVTELDGFPLQLSFITGTFNRFVNNRENQTEMFKLFFVLLLFGSSYLFGMKKYKLEIKYALFFAIPIFSLYLIQIYFLRYGNIFYSTIIPFASVILIIISIFLFYEHLAMKERVREEKQKTRDILARDLHDDLASTISSALIYSDMVERAELPEVTRNLILKIKHLLTEAAGVVTDIIWTVSPRHDNIEELVTRLQILMNDLCRANSIEFSSECVIAKKDLKIPDDTRRNIYLIYKEAINNTIKHSTATKVKFDVYFEEDLLNFSLYDNGVGFDTLPDIMNIKKNPGHGLRNIKTRAGEINADLQIKSGHQQGTTINIRQKVV
jgi:enediyne biosynthesis protein E4